MLIRTAVAIAIFAVSAVIHGFLRYRVAAFRKDQRWRHSYFGEAFELPTDTYNPKNYTEEGQRLLGWLGPSFILLAIAFLAAASAVMP
jgi:hypothetical protein